MTEKADKVLAAVRALGVQSRYDQVDVADPERVDAAAGEAIHRDGPSGWAATVWR